MTDAVELLQFRSQLRTINQPERPLLHESDIPFETLRNGAYALSRCADLAEMLQMTKSITEGDLESWYSAWAATAARVEALAASTQDSISKGDAYMRASTYQ
jgi:hypothetical protein